MGVDGASGWRGPTELRLLGPIDVRIGAPEARVRVPLGGPMQRSVLAILTVQAGTVVATDTVVHDLWGDAPPASAVGMVRSYVSRLRHALTAAEGCRVERRRPGYVLEIPSGAIDAHRFEDLADEARRALDAGDLGEAAAASRHALTLWRGRVLSDLPPLPSLQPPIARWEEMRLAVSECHIDAELALGHHAAIVAEVESLTSQHPFRERLWAQRIVALYRSGRQADALEVYQRARRVLIDEVGVEPGPELRALEAQVLDHADDLLWRPPTPAGARPRRVNTRPRLPPGLEPAAGRPHVGRKRELAVLEGHLDIARAGRFGLVLIRGVAGVGKTALVQQLGVRAHRSGVTVLAGWADEGAGTPYQPLTEVLTQWVAASGPDDLHRIDDVDAERLARLVPLLARRRGDRSPSPDTGGAPDRHQLFEALGRWLEVLAADAPVLLVLEDVHWADPACLASLDHLLRHPPGAGVLIVATLRETDPAGAGALTRLSAHARGKSHAERLELPALTDDEIVELLLATPIDTDLPSGADRRRRPDDDGRRALASRLAERTGGNPLLIHETLRHLVDVGAIDVDTGRWDVARPLADYGVPPGVAELIAQRLDHLPPSTVDVLGAAAVLGQTIEVPVLSRTLALAEVDVVTALEPAIDARMVAASARSGDLATATYEFVHALVRDAVLDRVPTGRRIRTHWSAGQSLAAWATSRPESYPDARLGEIAWHLTEGIGAGDPRTAVEANLRAGLHALVTLAFEEAAERFTTACRLLDRPPAQGDVPEIDADLAYRAWLGRGQAAGALADIAAQHDSHLRAVAIAQQRGRLDEAATAAVGLAAAAVARRGPVPPGDPTAALVEQILADTDTDTGGAEAGGAVTADMSLLMALLAVRCTVHDQPVEAGRWAEQASRTARAVGTPDATASALLARSWQRLGSPRHQLLGAGIDRALAVTLGPEAAVVVRGYLLPLRAVPVLQRADGRAIAQLLRRVEVDDHLVPVETRVHASCQRTWATALALARGELDRADELVGLVGLVDERAAMQLTWDAAARLQAGMVALERGQRSVVVPILVSDVAARPHVVGLRALLASLLAAGGDTRTAHLHVEQLVRHHRLAQLGWAEPFVLRHLAEVAARTHDRELATRLLPRLRAHTGQMLVGFTALTIEAAADRSIGQVLLALGRIDDAIAALTAAQAQEKAIGADALVARTRYWHARALLTRGAPTDRAAAARVVATARATARRRALSQLHADLEELLDDSALP